MLTNQQRAEFGLQAMQAGDPDWKLSDLQTSAVDTIANVLHVMTFEHCTDGWEALVARAIDHARTEVLQEL